MASWQVRLPLPCAHPFTPGQTVPRADCSWAVHVHAAQLLIFFIEHRCMLPVSLLHAPCVIAACSLCHCCMLPVSLVHAPCIIASHPPPKDTIITPHGASRQLEGTLKHAAPPALTQPQWDAIGTAKMCAGRLCRSAGSPGCGGVCHHPSWGQVLCWHPLA